jgi:hypothetical protein
MKPTPTLLRLHPRSVPDLLRVGRERDGGYVLPARVLQITDVLVGLGIETDWSFEADFLRRSNVRTLVAVDGSVSATIFARRFVLDGARSVYCLLRGRPGASLDWLRSARHYAAVYTAFVGFFYRPGRQFLSKMLTSVRSSTSVTWSDLRSRWSSAAQQPRLFIKMDIEGSEFDVLADVLAAKDQVVGFALEIHDLDRRWADFVPILDQLEEHFCIVHVHGNNHAPLIADSGVPSVIELTMLHRSLMTSEEQATPSRDEYPLRTLDRPCHPFEADYALRFELDRPTPVTA